MREILFRGKHTGDCGWVYGYLCDHRGDERVDVCGETISDFYIRDWMEVGSDIYGCNYAVDPATVGQYTGLKDKNGVKIFEGDLIKYDSRVFEMKYIDGFSAFSLRSADNMSLAPCITPNTCHRMEVVGNVWDNPELLEGGGEE